MIKEAEGNRGSLHGMSCYSFEWRQNAMRSRCMKQQSAHLFICPANKRRLNGAVFLTSLLTCSTHSCQPTRGLSLLMDLKQPRSRRIGFFDGYTN